VPVAAAVSARCRSDARARAFRVISPLEGPLELSGFKTLSKDPVPAKADEGDRIRMTSLEVFGCGAA
jgi:hypothetical protein